MRKLNAQLAGLVKKKNETNVGSVKFPLCDLCVFAFNNEKLNIETAFN